VFLSEERRAPRQSSVSSSTRLWGSNHCSSSPVAKELRAQSWWVVFFFFLFLWNWDLKLGLSTLRLMESTTLPFTSVPYSAWLWGTFIEKETASVTITLGSLTVSSLIQNRCSFSLTLNTFYLDIAEWLPIACSRHQSPFANYGLRKQKIHPCFISLIKQEPLTNSAVPAALHRA